MKKGEGSSAFIVDPPVPCADGRELPAGEFVSRVVPKEDFLEEEKEELQKWREYHNSIIRKLAEIDPEQKYFYYPDLSCTPGTLTEENEADGVTSGMRIELFRYAPGGTLRGRSLTSDQKAHVDEAVRRLRENHIRHGDLKNRENIVIAGDGLPRIIDWDSARFVKPAETPSASGPAGAGAGGKGGRRRTRRKRRTARRKPIFVR